MTKDERPDPDLILTRLSQKEEKERRGRLKIFFGSSAGVGKTYAMLKAGREHSEQNLNVLVGIVETHKRPETESLLEGMRILPPLEIRYRGLTLKELDLDAALTRKPDILLVDELAHSNAPGTRHPKRWNDVLELLDAGIDVYTTLNVQHIESLSDLIASTTGVWVKETVPDSIFDMAEDVVLVDIDEDDLIQRLHEGKVYVAPGAMARAAENFFKKSNLGALREIALRRTADRVDATREPNEENTTRPALAEKILVCLTADTLAAQLIRTTKRFATALKAPWEAVHVERPHLAANQPDKGHFFGTTERMVERMGGTFTVLRGSDVVEEIITYAREKKFSKIVVGKDSKSHLFDFFSNMFINRLINRSGDIDVYVVTGENTRNLLESKKKSFFTNFNFLNYLLSLVVVIAFTLPAAMTSSPFSPTDQALIYLIGIVLVAGKLGFGPSLFYALLAATSFHFFVLEPHHSFSLDDRSYGITFLIMLMTSYIIATQATRLRAQTFAARAKEKTTHDLLALARRLTSTNGRFPVAELVANHIKEMMGGNVTVWMMNADGHPAVVLGDLPELSYYKDFGALQWCLENNQMSGRDTDTLPSAGGIYFPLSTNNGTIGVIGYFSPDPDKKFSRQDIAALETLAELLATALARVRAGEIAQQALLDKASEQLRQTCLTAVTEHFHYAPQVETESMASDNKKKLDSDILQDITSSLNRESDKLSNSVNRLLHTKTSNIAPSSLNCRPVSLIDQVQGALIKLKEDSKLFDIHVNIPSNLPDVLIEVSMIEQALLTFLKDVFERASHGSAIAFSSLREDDSLKLIITFSASQEGNKEKPENRSSLASFALKDIEKTRQIGLDVATGIIRLHGGQAGIERREDGNTEYFLTLPIA